MKPNGNLTTSDKEKATVLNDFFTSVFTAENPNNIPNIEERNFESSLDHFVINQDTVEKYLLLLNGSKSMGPDNIHPLIVKKTSYSCREGNIKEVELSVKNGASLECRDPIISEVKCLTHIKKSLTAAKQGNIKKVELSVKNGASLECRLDPSDDKTCHQAFEDDESIPNDTKAEIKEEFIQKREHVIIITTLVDVAEGDGGTNTAVISAGTEPLDATDLEN
ncbi:unnamed protein product [Mytilus edulis]|uniref:Uncharacterized protein n=1 Tax=Mytilus edulis TaxID=6550 RepID=A0A8S3PNV1_MYTED|nr:unnamed protein product [Mytilus edulis]